MRNVANFQQNNEKQIDNKKIVVTIIIAEECIPHYYIWILMRYHKQLYEEDVLVEYK